MAGLALLALQVSLLGFYLGSYAAVLLFKLAVAAYRGWQAGWRSERRR
jgi:hypothetical protein